MRDQTLTARPRPALRWTSQALPADDRGGPTPRRSGARLEQRPEQAPQHVDESTYRCRRRCVAACAPEFESGEIGVHQAPAAKRATRLTALRLTRRHLYANPTALEGPTT